MSDIIRRSFMKEKEVRQLLKNFSQKIQVNTEQVFGLNPKIEQALTQTAEIIFVNGKPLLARAHETLFPTLIFDDLFPFLPKIVVDMGAVPYVCNGADVMAPGIVNVKGDFNEKNILIIMDERHKKSLAIGIALVNSHNIRTTKRGKVAKNIHHVGDKLWNTIKRFA